MLRPRFHAHRSILVSILHFFTKFDGLYDPSPFIGDSNVHSRQDREQMQLKNVKTNPFSPRAIHTEANHRPDRMPLFAINTAQKNRNFTGKMTKLGALKNEETKPTANPGNARPCNCLRRKMTNKNKGNIHAIF